MAPSADTGPAAPRQIDDALRWARQQGLDRLEASMLLLHALGRDRHDQAWLLAHDRDPLPSSAWPDLCAKVRRRQQGEPMAYLTGWRAFHGLELQVDARVLDPRPDTETLVDWALQVLPDAHSGPVHVIDLGTGSGAIALALKHRRPDVDVWALDASPDALHVLRHNAQRLQLDIGICQGHWLQDWPPLEQPQAPRRWHLVVSNPPYIAEGDPHLPDLRHEPLQALVSGPDGLDDIRCIVEQAAGMLETGGWLLLEHGWDQADAVASVMRHHGAVHIEHRHDLGGHCRCTGARWT